MFGFDCPRDFANFWKMCLNVNNAVINLLKIFSTNKSLSTSFSVDDSSVTFAFQSYSNGFNELHKIKT